MKVFISKESDRIIKQCNDKVLEDNINANGYLESTLILIEDIKKILKTTITFANKRYLRESMVTLKQILHSYQEEILVKYFIRPEIIQAIRDDKANLFNTRVAKLKQSRPNSFKYYCALKKSVMFMTDTLKSLFHEIYINHLGEDVNENQDLKKLEDLTYKISLGLVYICVNFYLARVKDFFKQYSINKKVEEVDENNIITQSQEILENLEPRLI